MYCFVWCCISEFSPALFDFQKFTVQLQQNKKMIDILILNINIKLLSNITTYFCRYYDNCTFLSWTHIQRNYGNYFLSILRGGILYLQIITINFESHRNQTNRPMLYFPKWFTVCTRLTLTQNHYIIRRRLLIPICIQTFLFFFFFFL